MGLPRIYQVLHAKSVFTTQDAVEVVKNYNLAALQLHLLVKKGYLQKVRRGLYAIVPVEFIGRSYQPDKFIVASRLTTPYTLSHYTAMELHGPGQAVLNQVYTSSPNRLLPFSHQGLEFKGVLTRDLFGVTALNHEGHTIHVTDTERTILDCLRQPNYAGGIVELIHSLERLARIDVARLLEYLKKFNEKALYAKAGFVLKLFAYYWKVKPEMLRGIKKNIGTTKYYFPRQLTRGTGKLVTDWNLIVSKYLLDRYHPEPFRD
ncbi:MAG: type IV toxin-antitoxin system AbiEi family antitoxin domain-containing protein [Planctomycetes bacterium]|nr:type IV toxin-antitoxin system AbiEi family antitoxin domain-containing protein [Planctomycetota bacterium]